MGFRPALPVCVAVLWATMAGSAAIQAVQEGVSNVSVRVTHRQAVLEFTAPGGGACTVDVFTDPGMTHPINDTNTGLFPQSNLDNRPGSISNGSKRIFVAGQIPIPGWTGYSVQETSAPIGIARIVRDSAGTVATVTTSGEHHLVVNDHVTISGAGDTSFNAVDVLVKSAPAADTFTYANTGAGDASSSGGQFWRVNRFSRALQADTQHWYRITCGSARYEGTFRTATVPVGSTYGELTAFDWASAPMKYLYPAIPNVRGYEVIDPVTGVLAKRVTLASDCSWCSARDYPKSFDAGNMVACPQQKTNGGYHCTVQSHEQTNRLYWFGEDGSTRYLGHLGYGKGADWESGFLSAQAYWDASDANVLYTVGTSTAFNRPVVLRLQYTGNDVEAAPGAAVPWQVTNLMPADGRMSLHDLIAAFDPSFSGVKFPSCSLAAVQGNRLLGACRALQQDSPAWLWVLDLGDKRPLGSCATCMKMVAAAPIHRNPRTRWCGLHYPNYIPGGDVFHAVIQSLRGGTSTGPWWVALQNAGGVSTETTVITVDGEPVCDPASLPRDGSTYLQDAAAGDVFEFADAPEYVRIVAKEGKVWTIQRGYGGSAKRSHVQGARLKATCTGLTPIPGESGPDIFWRYPDDPRAADESNTFWIKEPHIQNLHRVERDPYDIAAGWLVRKGSFPADNFNKPATFKIEASASFAGVWAGADGNSYQKHPSFENWNAPLYERRNWFLDLTPFQIGPVPDEVAERVGTTAFIYRVAEVKAHPRNFKKAPYIGISGDKVLLDISGPSSLLQDSSADHFKVCAAFKAGECWPGSAPGDMYANLPRLDIKGCAAGESYGGQLDLCTMHSAVHGQAVVQLGLDGPLTAGGAVNSRVLIRGLSGAWRRWGGLTNARALPDGEWMLFPTTIFDDNSTGENTNMLARVPRMPAPDGIDRSDFVPIPVTSPPVAGAVNTLVQFGYDASRFRCTQRRETCVAVSAAYDRTDPYKFAETESYTGLDCTMGCTITIPAISDRVVYYRWVYRGAGGAVLATGAPQAIVSSRPELRRRLESGRFPGVAR